MAFTRGLITYYFYAGIFLSFANIGWLLLDRPLLVTPSASIQLPTAYGKLNPCLAAHSLAAHSIEDPCKVFLAGLSAGHR